MKSVILVEAELDLLRRLLGDLRDRYTCASCNDMDVEANPNTEALVAAIEREWDKRNDVPNRPPPLIRNGKILTMDFMVLEYFQKKFGLEVGAV
jgi:hypothetical protein